MNVVVVGSGGREHALATVLGRYASVVVTPGNPGIAGSVSTPPEELEADLFVIGPEAPLVEGLADRLRAQGKRVFGPGMDGAKLEGSKAWMKEILVAAGVPTARYGAFTDVDEADAFLATLSELYVIKTDGLAAGKGVLVTDSLHEAQEAVRSYLRGDAFGDAGRVVVIEEGLVGPELSVFALCDGTRAILCGAAQDFKRVGEGDTGPNTGGMGAFSPVPLATDALLKEVLTTCIEPTLQELLARGIDYRGFLFAGLMLTKNGPKMLEYNVRFGDPEAEVILPRCTSNLAQTLYEAAEGRVNTPVAFDSGAAVTVVCAAQGYPVSPKLGDVIYGLDQARTVEGVTVFCAGVAANDVGELVTAGGRVLMITGQGASVQEARSRAYSAVSQISWPGMVVREDIAANS